MQHRAVISEEIRTAIAEIAEVEPETIGLQTNLVRDLEMDSLMSIELLFLLERRYGIEIPQEAIPSLFTIDGIVDVVTSQLGQDQS